MEKILITLTLSVISLTVLADGYAPNTSCLVPSKPYQFNSQWEVDSFNDDVQRYKRCISDFIDEQNEAISRHEEAANDAIEEWNRFVRYELN